MTYVSRNLASETVCTQLCSLFMLYGVTFASSPSNRSRFNNTNIVFSADEGISESNLSIYCLCETGLSGQMHSVLQTRDVLFCPYCNMLYV